MNEENLRELNQLLMKDEDFRNKFSDVFDKKEKIVFQVVDTKEINSGCNCYPGLCGKGCFYGPNMPSRAGHLVG